MKALYKGAPGAGLELVERPDPIAGTDDVVIRVLRTGICGTDLHILRWDDWAASAIAAPLIPGHEFYGEVVEVGPGVHDIAVGDRVSGEGHIVCGTCRNCRAGSPPDVHPHDRPRSAARRRLRGVPRSSRDEMCGCTTPR